MKAFLSLLISVILYFILGIIAWNILYTNINVGALTIPILSDLHLSCYSAITLILTCLLPHFTGDKVEESYYLFPLIVIGVNLGIAICVNHWEGAWEVVTNIIAFIYNVVNIGFLAYIIYFAFFHKSKCK